MDRLILKFGFSLSNFCWNKLANEEVHGEPNNKIKWRKRQITTHERKCNWHLVLFLKSLRAGRLSWAGKDMNNKARHNLSNVKYRQMAFWSVDSAVVGSFLEPLGQTKVMHSHKTWSLFWFVSIGARLICWVSWLISPSQQKMFQNVRWRKF